jgi:hypothetical protein
MGGSRIDFFQYIIINESVVLMSFRRYMKELIQFWTVINKFNVNNTTQRDDKEKITMDEKNKLPNTQMRYQSSSLSFFVCSRHTSFEPKSFSLLQSTN